MVTVYTNEKYGRGKVKQTMHFSCTQSFKQWQKQNRKNKNK